MEPTTHPSRAELMAFERGQLQDDAWSAVEQHLLQCTACAESLEQCPAVTWAELTQEWETPEQDATLPGAGAPGRSEEMRQLEAAEVLAAFQGHPRYDVERRIGAGGMGIVFAARHRRMDRVVALKVLRPALLSKSAAVERFRLEIQAAAKLTHPHIVTAYDADQAGDLHFLAMEYVDGRSLDEVLKQGRPLPVEDVCRWMAQAAAGLQYAAQHGMVHRDLKPSNLMLTADGNIKILDFGLARFASEQVQSSRITPADAVIGTPDYLAPEQAMSPATADIRADIYSLGCTMYHLLTGRVPFPVEGIVPKIMAHQNETPASAASQRPDLPHALDQVLQRMLAKNPRQRFQTPAAVIEALAPFNAGRTTKLVNGRRPVAVSWIVGVAGGIAALLLLTFALSLWRGDRLPEKTIDDNAAPNLDQGEKDDAWSPRADPNRIDDPVSKKKHKKKK